MLATWAAAAAGLESADVSEKRLTPVQRSVVPTQTASQSCWAAAEADPALWEGV